MKIEDLYNELTRVNKIPLNIMSLQEKESLSVGWVNRYRKENNKSLDDALDDLSDYAEQQIKIESTIS